MIGKAAGLFKGGTGLKTTQTESKVTVPDLVGMTEEEAKAAYEAYKNGLIETHQDQITYYLDAS